MIHSKSIPRRWFLLSARAALACAALPLKFARAKTASGRKNRRHPIAIPDYERNPFLRPVGPPYTPAEQFGPVPMPRHGRGAESK